MTAFCRFSAWHAWAAVAALALVMVAAASMTGRDRAGAGDGGGQSTVRLTASDAPVIFGKDFFSVTYPPEKFGYGHLVGSCQIIRICRAITIKFIVRSKTGAFIKRAEVMGSDVPVGRWDFTETITHDNSADVIFEGVEWIESRR